MKRKSFSRLFIMILLSFNSFMTPGSEKPDSLLLLKQLNSSAIPISLDSAVNYEQFSFLDKSIKESRIVGLGEATHGTHEFVKGNTEIIKYLVRHMNFKVIVFESQYGGTDLLNKYIKGEDVSINQAIYNIGFYHLMNNDVLDFVKWLREYNTNKKQEEQVMVYGCDSQSSRYVIDDLVEFLDDHQSLSKELKDRLIDLKDKMHETPKKVLHQTLNLLESSLKPLNANDEIRQKQQIVIQSVDLASSSLLSGILKRDNYMAQNCSWLFNANHQSKMTIYAHNMHIAKTWDNSMKILMGQHLLQLYPDYFVIGTGFNHGKVGLTGSTIVERSYKEAIYGSYDFVFTQCKYASYFLDFDSINGEALKSYVGTKNLSRNTGANQPLDNTANVKLNYRKHILSKSYDALIYFKESSPSQIIPAFKIH